MKFFIFLLIGKIMSFSKKYEDMQGINIDYILQVHLKDTFHPGVDNEQKLPLKVLHIDMKYFSDQLIINRVRLTWLLHERKTLYKLINIR